MSTTRRSGGPPLSISKNRRSGGPPLKKSKSRRNGAPPLNQNDQTPPNAASRRVCDSAVSALPHETGYFRPEDEPANLAGNLPHWRQEGVTYFVTFRLADSLPRARLEEWLYERDAWLAVHPKPWDLVLSREYHRRFTAKLERWLDAGYGSCVLARSELRSIVTGTLRHFDGIRYGLDAWVVMPNHVHVLLTPWGDYSLSTVVQTWKSFTSHSIGKLLPDWKGAFWQKESFDHIVRGPDHLERFRLYIENNPRKLSPDRYSLYNATQP
jgi:REP element-mobilizing transposase RayT